MRRGSGETDVNSKTVTRSLVAVALSVTLAACGGTSHRGKTAHHAKPCDVYLYGHNAQLNVTSSGDDSPEGECAHLATSLSGAGDFWTTQMVASSDGVSVVCGLKNDQWVVVIRDAGGQIYGQLTCSALIRDGWAEDTDAEKTAQGRDQQAAQARAAADARAIDSAHAQQDLSDLQDSLKHFTNAQTLRDDAAATDVDLESERRDAADGNGDQCVNVDTTVYNDADTTVYNDVLTTVSNDADTESTRLKQLRDRISAVQGDEITLKQDGLPALDGADDAIKTGQADVAKAVKTANAAIDQANGDLSTAYEIANNMGTGDCAGDGPGDAPDGVPHVS